MKIVGFSTGATGKVGNVDRMVQAVMAKTGWDSEFVKLTDLSFTGCKGCVELCAKPQVCKADDGMLPHYQTLKDADAIVLGAPVYMGSMNATMRAFVERFYGYRHVSIAVSGKPVVLVLAGCAPAGETLKEFKQILGAYNLNVVEAVHFCTLSPPCFTCGRHKDCKIGGLYMMVGDKAATTEITPDMFKTWEDDPATVQAIEKAAEELAVYEEEEDAPAETAAAHQES